MTATARAAVAVEALHTELWDFPVPDIGPDEGLVEMEASGVCGTDWGLYRRSLGGDLGPLILGHENVGRLDAVGDAAADRWGVAAGDRVAVEEFLPCGTCRLCRSGHYRICEATDSRRPGPFLRYGATPVDRPPGLWGGFSQYLYLHPHTIVYRVPDGVSPDLAALFVPIGNGIRWVLHEGGGELGQSILIQGPGQHGLGCVVAAREAGLGPIVVSGLSADDARLEVAGHLGADHLIRADGEDVEAAVMEVTDGLGVDMVVDVTPGATETVETAIACAAKRGVVVLAGGKHGRPVSRFAHDDVVRKELVLRGVRGHDHRSVEPALRLIASGRYPLDEVVTNTFPLEEADRALRVVGERTDPAAIHVNVVPQTGGA
ncbi:MAG: alcohol dehydrogenase catalytic domain-containing protein [Nitriliruptorales bacterium]|nr:alcohol dehydrogenase catalytic domain-containing protein [Nitriliruptorales bacterium]